MKQLLTALLAIAAISSFAASFVRVDIDGLQPKNKLTFENSDVLPFRNVRWGKEEEREFRFTSDSKAVAGDQWKEYSVSFKSETAGSVSVAFSGRWEKSEDKMGWVSFSNVKLNGKLLPNGDLKKFRKDKSGRTVGIGFYGKGLYSAEGGPDGMGMETVNHNNRLYFKIKVEAGKSYTLTFVAKAAEAPSK